MDSNILGMPVESLAGAGSVSFDGKSGISKVALCWWTAIMIASFGTMPDPAAGCNGYAEPQFRGRFAIRTYTKSASTRMHGKPRRNQIGSENPAMMAKMAKTITIPTIQGA
jgi:hypothetical protein